MLISYGFNCSVSYKPVPYKIENNSNILLFATNGFFLLQLIVYIGFNFLVRHDDGFVLAKDAETYFHLMLLLIITIILLVILSFSVKWNVEFTYNYIYLFKNFMIGWVIILSLIFMAIIFLTIYKVLCVDLVFGEAVMILCTAPLLGLNIWNLVTVSSTKEAYFSNAKAYVFQTNPATFTDEELNNLLRSIS